MHDACASLKFSSALIATLVDAESFQKTFGERLKPHEALFLVQEQETCLGP